MTAQMFLDDRRFAGLIDIVMQRQKEWGDVLLACQDVRACCQSYDDPLTDHLWVDVGNKPHVLKWFQEYGFAISGNSIKVHFV